PASEPREERREPRRDSRREGRGRDRESRRAPVASFTRWQPPNEPDDDRPILAASRPFDEDPSSRLPGVAISDGPATEPHHGPVSDVAPDVDGAEFLQLFVNVGKRDGVRAADLQKLLSDRGVSIDGSSGIRVRDRMTFVRVPKELFDDAVAALSGQVIGGRTVVAELARGTRA